MRRFPSFVALVAFDAVARCGSFTAAAQDLGITQSAVSHQVKRLEALLGMRLIDRHHTGIALTSKGAELASELMPLLARLARIGDRTTRQPAPKRLRVGVGSALSSLWLARRIPDLLDHIPDCGVELIETAGDEPNLPADIDVMIHWVAAAKVQPSPTHRILFRETVFPVCHPSLIERYLPRSLEDLAKLRLLHKRTPANYDGGGEWSWTTWFNVFGAQAQLGANAPFGDSPLFTNIGPMLTAAMEGAGVALGRSLLVHDAIQSGRLVQPLNPTFAMPSSKIHLCVWHPESSDDGDIAAFVDWLTMASRGTVEAVSSIACDPVDAPLAVIDD